MHTYRYEISPAGEVVDSLLPAHKATIQPTGIPGIYGGWGTDPDPNGDPFATISARFELQPDGVLHAKWGDAIFYLVRAGDPRASRAAPSVPPIE